MLSVRSAGGPILATMTEMTPALWLTDVTRSRAWSVRTRVGFVIAYLLGGLPAALFVALMRSDGFGDLPLIAAMFVFGPVVASAVWCSIDRSSADSRELLMWLTAISKTRSQRPLPHPANEAIDMALAEASEMVSRGASPSEVLIVVRSAVQRQFVPHKRIGLFVAYARFSPVVWWGAFALVLVAAFVVILLATPSCGPDGSSSLTMCH
jgi:hypothetical protein